MLRKKQQASAFTEAFEEPYLAGCFPPKPPARLLVRSDHRRGGEFRQEYGGNEREILFSLASACGQKA
jgi:hypothetical protein